MLNPYNITIAIIILFIIFPWVIGVSKVLNYLQERGYTSLKIKETKNCQHAESKAFKWLGICAATFLIGIIVLIILFRYVFQLNV